MDSTIVGVIVFMSCLGCSLIVRATLFCIKWCHSLAQIEPADEELEVIPVYYVGTGRRLGDVLV